MLNPGNVRGAGGVKIYGFEHQVTGNWFQGLTGTGHEAPLALIPGIMDTESTDRIGKAYRDLTSAPATRVAITGNTWIDCSPLCIGYEKPDRERRFVPEGCSFTGNVLVATNSPLIRLGLVRDFQAKDNIGYATGVRPVEARTSWFHWENGRPSVTGPRPLTPADVGPEAP